MIEFARVVLDNFWSWLGSVVLLTVFMCGIVDVAGTVCRTLARSARDRPRSRDDD